MYLKVIELMRKAEAFLLEQDLEYGHRRNIRFYVTAVVACEVTKSADPSDETIAGIDINAVSDELLRKCYKRVWTKYEKLGKSDSVSKGIDLLKKLRTDIKRRCARETVS